MARYTIGRILPIFHGDWDSTQTYDKLDIVLKDTISYVSLIDNNTTTPSANSQNWQVVCKAASVDDVITALDLQYDEGTKTYVSGKEITLQSGDGLDELYPNTMGDLVYDLETGKSYDEVLNGATETVTTTYHITDSLARSGYVNLSAEVGHIYDGFPTRNFNSDYRGFYVDVQAGDIITYHIWEHSGGSAPNSTNPWGFVAASNYELLAKETHLAYHIWTDGSYTATVNGRFYINTQKQTTTSDNTYISVTHRTNREGGLVPKVNSLESDLTSLSSTVTTMGGSISTLSNNLGSLDSQVQELATTVGDDTSYTLIASGSHTTGAAYNNKNINYEINAGDEFRVVLNITGNSTVSFRMTPTDPNESTVKVKNIVTETSQTADFTFTAPVDCYRFLIVMTVVNETTTVGYQIYSVEDATGLVKDVIDINTELSKMDERIDNLEKIKVPQYESILGEDGCRITSNTLSDGSILPMSAFPYSNKVGNHFTFTAKIDHFSSLLICQGYNTNYARWIEINDTYVDVYWNTGSRQQRVTHNLTFSNYISVNIQINNQGDAVTTIMTGDNTFSEILTGWDTNATGLVQVRSVGTTLHDVVFTATNIYFRCPLWIFGASQEGFTTTRYLGQLRLLGYRNYLANALPGRDSSNILNDLKRALNFGCPKYVYFALSNDGYTYDTYKTRMDKAKSCAEEYGFTIIFVAKGVTPNTSSGSQEAQLTKRNTVINYGERYVDFGEAIAQDPTDPTTIYSGWMDSEYVHPATAQCARAIAMRVLSDIPEIMQYGDVVMNNDTPS